MEQDFSKEIFENWYEPGKIVSISLKNGVLLEGVLVGFYHGEENEPYIIMWDFIAEDDYQALDQFLEIPDSIKLKLKQDDILSVNFKSDSKGHP